MTTLPLFGFVPAEDRQRLKTALQRVFWSMSSGRWVSATTLQSVGGISWSRRVRNLREARFGSLEVEARKSDRPGVWEYRLDVDSVPLWAWISYRSGVFPPCHRTTPEVLKHRLLAASRNLDEKTLALAVDIVESLARNPSQDAEQGQK